MVKYYYWIIGALFALDRLTKVLALAFLPSGDIDLIPGCRLSLTFNEGVSWSLMSGINVIPIVCCVTIIFGIYSAYRTHQLNAFIPEQLVLTGAVSNLLDRFLYSGVVDFVECFIGNYHWPTYNLADCYVVIGVMWMLWRQKDELFG